MIEIPYTRRRFEKCINFKDIIKDKLLLDRENRKAAASRTLKAVNTGTAFQVDLKKVSVRGKVAYTHRNIEQELSARLISKNIRANYKIRQQNRNVIIKNLISLLKESCPYHVHRFDIQNFFESIDRAELFKRLMNDGKCSRQTLLLVYQLFEKIESQKISGLPRGLGISATLSDYTLHEFDSKIKRERNVFFYARFVDDIVLITSPEMQKGDVIKLIEDNIFPGLKIHKSGNKIHHHQVNKATDKSDQGEKQPKRFEYLGYQFSIFEENNFHDTILGFSKRRLEIDICHGKIDKLKSRIITSFTSYLSNPSAPGCFSLLEKRVKALTGNYIINDPITKINIKTGIYYNYAEKNNRQNCPLVSLDALLRGLLFSSHHHLSRRICKNLTLAQRKKLIGYTFNHGFYGERLHFFTHEDLKQMKEAWKK